MISPDNILAETQDFSEPADISLAMLCHRISRLQTEAEAVAKAISANGGSIRNKQSISIPVSNQQYTGNNSVAYEEQSTITDLNTLVSSSDNNNNNGNRNNEICRNDSQQLSQKSQEQTGHALRSTNKEGQFHQSSNSQENV
ncbi:unnamed protein product [Trichobilharzia szidati]|nr:unnamed protein product [Trichobilharzia szidati]